MNQHLVVEYLFHYLCCMKMKDPDKVSLIYSATLSLVRQNGLTGLTMAAIGKEAQMGMGTIYVYFKSKEELINSLFKRLKSLNTSRIYAPIAPHAPFMLNMRQLYESYLQNRIDFYEEHFFVEQCSNSHFLDGESRRLDAAAFEGVFALLERGKQEMIVKDLDNALLTAQMMGAANEIASMIMKNNQKLTPGILEQAFILGWDSIKR
jgi:AcrR family transcriptional regulator